MIGRTGMGETNRRCVGKRHIDGPESINYQGKALCNGIVDVNVNGFRHHGDFSFVLGTIVLIDSSAINPGIIAKLAISHNGGNRPASDFRHRITEAIMPCCTPIRCATRQATTAMAKVIIMIINVTIPAASH